MKRIVVILPANNPAMLNQKDLESYQSDAFFFEVKYADTSLLELNTAEDVAMVIPPVLAKIQAAEMTGAVAVVVYAFGDVGIMEARSAGVKIPVVGLGNPAVHQAYDMASRFTVIPSQLAHSPFIENLVTSENLSDKFVASKHAIGLNPSELRGADEIVIPKIVQAARMAITQTGADTLTVGCGSFIERAVQVKSELKKLLGRDINVIEPAQAAFDYLKHILSR